ncbi:MAG: HAMP domain-containing sensor histidine kinase [Planctomycetota bacterium]|nr:HAMP domain-containing sensor histidine kinase [Planctomycetota bacterium]
MDRPIRIAVVGRVDDRLVGDLRQLPLGPEVRPLTSVVADTEALMGFQPDVLLVQLPSDPSEDIGAVKLLQRLWPALVVGVLTAADAEVQMAPVAARLSSELVLYPDAPGQLAAAVERLLQGGDRPRPELFVDLAHGLADEINNPLMFASGHLQLLKAQLHPRDDADRCSQVDAALDGLGRIQAAVERLRLLSQAADGPTADDRVDLGALISHAVRARASGAATAAVEIEPGEHAVQGDLAQLTLAVAAVVEFADEIAAVVPHCQLTLGATEGAYRLRLLARGQGLATWQLPNTFEPFYPQRLIRGQSHGLGLFLAQTVVHGHRGQATARRQADGGLQLDFLLPK